MKRFKLTLCGNYSTLRQLFQVFGVLLGVELINRLRSALSFYLILALAIPPQVWADAVQPAKQEEESVTTAKILEGTPLLKAETRRDKLRFQFHAGSRFVESVVRQRTPGLISLRGVDYHVILRPYAHCPVDAKRVGQDPAALIEDIDSKVIAPLQKELATFFAEKGPTLVNLGSYEPEEGLQSPSVDVLSAEGDLCIPLVWDAEDSDPTTQLGTASSEKNLDAAVKVRKRLETTQAQGLEYLQPWFLELSRKRADNLPLTNTEARRWLAWLKALRDFRSVLASQLQVTKAMPEMILAPGPATRVAANNKRVAEVRAVELIDANQMMNASQLSEELPRFVPCAEKKKDCGVEPTGTYEAGTLCFCDGGNKAGTRAEEKVFQSLHPTLTSDGKSTPPSMGAHLNAERLLAIQALMMELATVASLLPSQVRPENMADLLPAACRASDDLRDQVKVFENYSTIRFREWWLQRLHTAADQYGEAVRVGKQAVAIPNNPKFYAKANALMQDWVKSVIPAAPEVALGGPASVNGESVKEEGAPAEGEATQNPAVEGETQQNPAAEPMPVPEAVEKTVPAEAAAPVAETAPSPTDAAVPPAIVDGAPVEGEATPAEGAPAQSEAAEAVPAEGEVSQAPVEKPLSPQEQMLQMIATFPFEERILDGTERAALGNGRNFAEELGRLVTLWGALIPWEFEKLTDAQFSKRDTLVAEMMREAYEAALVNVFMGYAASFFQGDPALYQKAMSEWEKRYRIQWQQLVASTRADTPFKQEINLLAENLSKQLLAMPAFQEKFDADRMADDALTGYVALVGPRAKEAFVANQIEYFMESHRQKLTNPIAGPANLIPGGFWNPNNYFYQAAQARNVTDAPACFQVEDGNGHDKRWYELFISSIRPGEPLDYLHLKKAMQGMAVSYRQPLVQRITKLLLKTESQVDDATANWVMAQYPKRATKGRTVRERAVSLLANLPDEDVTLAAEHQASLVAGKYFKGGANVGSIADIVIEKFFETLDAKDGKDRGRTRAARQASFVQLQEWLGQSLSREQFLELRRDAAVRIYDYHLRVLLEARTKENAASVDAQLTTRLKELGEQKILLDVDAIAEKLPALIAAQDRFRASMAAGESRNAIHEFWQKSALEEKVFDNWADTCAKDPVKCQAWFEQASKVFEEPTLDSYFHRRAQSVAKALLPPFLGAYGAGRKMYSGKPSKANEILLDSVTRRLLQGWVGFIPEEVDAEKKPIPVAQYEAAKPWIQNFLIEMSKAAQAEGGNELALEEMPARVSALAVEHKLFAEWKTRIEAQRAQIAAAIAGKNLEELKKIHPLVLQTFFAEVQELVNGSYELTPENLRVELISEVAQSLLPGFTRLREELNGTMAELLKAEADPMETLRSAEERLTELKDVEWEQKDKDLKVKDPHKTLETEIAYLEKNVIPKAKAQIHREMVFGWLAKTYLPSDLSSAVTAGSASNLWLSFLQRQFFDSLQDARGEAMPFSMTQLLADLNAVARKVEAPLDVDAEVAKKFVAETQEYLSGWLSNDALKASFDAAVAQTLSRDRGMLGDLEQEDPELWGAFVNALNAGPDSRDVALFKQATERHALRPVYESVFRLHRIWFMAAGNVEGFTDWMTQSAEQVSRNVRIPIHMTALANLAGGEAADAEAWRLFTHAAESGVDSDAFRQLEKLGNLGRNGQNAIRDLNRQWVQLKGNSEGFAEWFAGLMDGSAAYDAIKENAPMGQGFPVGNLFAKVLVDQATALIAELEKIAKPKEGEKPVLLTADLRKRYTAFARFTSDLLYHPASQLGPLVVAADKIVWPQVPPTTDMAVSVRATEDGGFELANRGIDHRFLTQSILDVLGRPKMDKTAFSQIVSPFALRPLGVEIPDFKTLEEKIAWVNSLSIAARMAVFNSLQQMIHTNLILSPAVAPALIAAFEPEGQPTILTQKEWLNQFARELGVWARFRASFSLSNPPPPAEGELAAPIAGLDGVALSLVRSFTDYTSYRLVDGKRWEVIGSAALEAGKLSDQAQTLAAFTQNLKTDRRRAFEQVEDILRIFRRELNENNADAETEFFLKTVLELQGADAAKLPFHGLFAAPETLEQLTPLEVAARVYSRRFGPDALEEKNNNQVLVNQWRAQYALRTLTGKDPFDRLFVGFEPFWVQGTPSDSRKHFEEWVARLKANPGAEKAFAEVKAEAPGLVKRPVESFESLAKLVESPAYQQILGLMTVADSNSRYKAQEETYPYFLVLLDWNLNEHSSPLKPGAATVLPFDDSMRVRFMNELVGVLGLDRKAFSGWESLLKRKGQHEHFAAMARSKKNGLVGVEDNRFLSTGVAGDWTGRGWLGGTQGYDPIPVVSESERNRLQMEPAEGAKVGDFALYSQKLKGPEAQAATRMNRDGEAKRPLYQNLLSLQSQMFAEKDVQEAHARAGKILDPESVRMAKQRNRAAATPSEFGSKNVIETRRAEMVQRALKLKGTFPVPTVEELQKVSQLREPFVDFRRTLGEVSDPKVAVELLDRYLRQIDPKLTAKQASAIALSVYPASLRKPKGGGAPEPKPVLGEVRERALFVASEFTHRKAFLGQTKEDQDRTAAILTMMDDVYQSEMQKFEVRDALGTVVKNNQDYLAKLCAPETAAKLESVRTKEDLESVESLLKETSLAYSTGIHKYLYFDSGLVDEGIDNETRRRVDGIVRKLSTYRQTMETTGHYVNWAVGIGLFAFLFSKPFPGVGSLGRASMRSSAGRYGMIAATALIAGYFGWQAVDDIFNPERLWAGDEMEVLRKVAETQFAGYRPLRRDKDVGTLDDQRIHDRVEATTNVPTMRRAWRLWLLSMTYTMLSPYLRAATGGVRYAWYTRGRIFSGGGPTYANRELAYQAARLGLDAKVVMEASPLEAKQMIQEAQTRLAVKRTAGQKGKAVKNAPEMAEEIFPSENSARLMRNGIDAEIKSLSSQNYLDPVTGRALRIPEPPKPGFWGWIESKVTVPNWVKNPVAKGVQKASLGNREAQMAAEERVKFLKQLKGKLDGANPHFNIDDTNRWLGAGMDVRFANTPTWVFLSGVPFYRNEVISLVGNLQKMAGHAQAAQRMLAVRWMLKWRLGKGGLEVFRRVAESLNCEPIELLDALHMRGHKYRSIFSVQVDGELSGVIATFEKQQGLREELIASAQELIQVMELGGWRPDHRVFQMMLERSSVQGDRELVRRLISDQHSIALRASGTKRQPKEGVADDELGFEGEIAVELPEGTPDFLKDVTDAWAEPVAKKSVVTARGTILPGDARTQSEVIAYLEKHMTKERLGQGMLEPASVQDRKWIFEQMKRLDPRTAAIVEENGILWHEFTAEDISGVAAHLRTLGEMSNTRETAYQAASAYLRAFETFGRSADFDVAARVYAEALKFSGNDRPMALASRVYEILYGEIPAGPDFANTLRRTQTLAGDLASTPIAREVGDRNLQALERLVESLRVGSTDSQRHLQALARLKDARELFGSISQVDDLEVALSRAQTFSRSLPLTPADRALAARANAAADSRTPEALRRKVYDLLEAGMRSDTLEAAMITAQRNPKIWNTELAETFRYAMAYTRAVEVAGSDAVRVNMAARLQLDLMEIAGGELSAINEMYTGLFGRRTIRTFDRLFSALNLSRRSDLKAITERADLLIQKLQALKAHPQIGTFATDVDVALNRLADLKEIASFRAGDFGFSAAWKELATGAEEMAVMARFESEVLGADLTSQQVMERLANFRLKLIREVAEGTQPVIAIETMARASTAIRSKLLLKLMKADGVKSPEALESLAKALMEYSRTAKLRFPMSPAEAETYIVAEWQHQFHSKIDPAGLRKAENLERLKKIAKENGMKQERWTPFLRAIDALHTNLPRSMSLDRSWLRLEDPLALPWEVVTHPEILKDPALFHYIAGGDEAATEGVSTVRVLLMENPEAEVLDGVLAKLLKSHKDHFSALERENASRMKSNMQPKSEQEHGPSALQEIFYGLQLREQWATEAANTAELLQLERAMNRLAGKAETPAMILPEASQGGAAPGPAASPQ